MLSNKYVLIFVKELTKMSNHDDSFLIASFTKSKERANSLTSIITNFAVFISPLNILIIVVTVHTIALKGDNAIDNVTLRTLNIASTADILSVAPPKTPIILLTIENKPLNSSNTDLITSVKAFPFVKLPKISVPN